MATVNDDKTSPKQDKKVVSDDDWKRQAEVEKEKLSTKEKDAGRRAAPGPLPAPDFLTLINSLVIQIMYCLGRVGEPDGTRTEPNLDLAKHHIDMLQVLEDKTKGNLTPEESKALAMVLHEVRMLYVQTAQVK
jgi:hypothetical protein